MGEARAWRPPHADLGQTAYFASTRITKNGPVLVGEVASAALRALWEAREKYDFLLLSFALMPDHAHFIVVPRDGFTIGQTMRLVKGSLAKRVNELLNREGRVWQPGFLDKIPRTVDELNAYVRYADDNPAAAGLAPPGGQYAFASFGEDRCRDDYNRFLGLSNRDA